MKTSAENISNSILQSIDIVLQERIKELAFDKTLICTIIDDRDKKNGKYQVTDGSIKFWAYSSVDTYSKDEQVRVSVANGDMTQDKYIIGKYIANNDVKPISFVSPLEKVLDISDNLISETSSAATYGLAANGLDSPTEEPAAAITEHEGVEYLTIAQIDIERDYPHYASLQNNKIYDTLYMQADFKSLLNHDYVTSGTFGLMIDLAIKGEDGSYTKHSVVFDNSKMFGNPYNFALYSRQQAKFDIASLGTITGLRVYFFQANDFYNYKGERVSTKILDKKLVKNLLIQNIIVGFGADLSKHNDNTLKLYSNNSTYYNDDTANITKELAISWYNKTPEDKYLGFSDGVAGDHFTYDETNYISARKRANQLRSQLSDNVHNSAEGLELSYEIKLIKPELEIIGNKIQKDLCNALTSFGRKIADAQITDLDGLIVQIDEAGSKIKKQASEMYDYYFEVLKWASQSNPKPEKVVESTAAPDQIISKPDPKNYTNLLSEQIAILQNNLWRVTGDDKVFLPLVADALSTDEKKEFRSYYDASTPRLIEIYNEIIKLWDKVLARLDGSDNSLNNEVILNNLPNYKSFDETFDSTQDANKYSIYWYRKDESVLEGDEIMPTGWSVIRQQTPDSEVQNTHYNFGLPNADPDNEGYLLKVPESGQSAITVALDPKKKNETFKVILFYNHERFESNELVFTNTKELINEENLKRANALSIKHGELSKDVYQEYGMSNSLMNIADRYKKRMLSVDFALADGAVDNLQLVGTQIFWYVPNRATMLTYDLEDIENLNKETVDSDPVNPFINDVPKDGIDPIHSEHYRDGYTCFYKTICKGMRLPDTELAETDPQAYESQLAAVTAALEKDIQFCYRIRDYYVPSFSNNMICCKVVKDDVTYEAEISFTFASYGTSGTDYTLVITPSGRQAAVTPKDALLLDVMLFNGDNEQIAFGSEGCSIGSPVDGIEYKDDNKIIRYTIGASDNHYQGIFEVSVKVPYSKNKDGTAIITAYYPIAWSSNKDYYMEGGSMVVYNSQGVNPSYYKDPYRLFTQAYKDTISTGTWGVHYWDGGRNHTEIVDPEEQKQYQVDFNFLPVMQDNKLIPSNMYIDFTDEQKVWTPYVCCTDWYQPILIIQNKYGLPMLNNWDGSLQIDEKNGTILASMIGAGRKTEKNTFEGVLMGDVQKAEGDDGQDEFDYNNKRGLGIYGFNDGAQSFGFSVDGTAFIGKSGRGRILFDGHSGQISSASYQQTMLVDNHAPGENNKPTAESNLLKSIAKAGMMIDLDDGRIDMLGAYSTLDEGVEKYVEDTYGAGHKDRPKDSVTPELAEEDQVNIPINFDQRGDLIDPSTNSEDADEADWNPQQVHISLDSRARNGKPYFRLTDVRGKDLIYAGDKHLFIKSSNYIASPTFRLEDGFTPIGNGESEGYGMKIDLYQGLLDAYNLRITSRTFFLDSRKNAKANLIVKDSYTGKNLIYMGVPSTTAGEYPTDKDKIANQWYFQSGNYKEAVIDEDGATSEEGTGMKIDLGLGLIDAYNFKLTSKNVLIDSTKDAKVYFEVKGYNAGESKYYSLFKVYQSGAYHKATLAGWDVDWNSIRIGELGKAGSYWMCRSGTESPAATGFVGNTIDANGVETQEKNWCLTIGQNFGVNKDGHLFGRGVTIKEGSISISKDNVPMFTVDTNGILTAKGGTIGKDFNTGKIIVNNVDLIAGGSGNTYNQENVAFIKDQFYATQQWGIVPNLKHLIGGIANNNFYLGPGGLIMRPNMSTGQYLGIRLTASGLRVNGSTNSSYGDRGVWINGDGITFYTGQNLFTSVSLGTPSGGLGWNGNIFQLSHPNLRLYADTAGTIDGEWTLSDKIKLPEGIREVGSGVTSTTDNPYLKSHINAIIAYLNGLILEFNEHTTLASNRWENTVVYNDTQWVIDIIKQTVKENALQ